MAYIEENPANDVFKRNTQYKSFNGLVCCTCSYCVKTTQQPQLKLKNFRPRPNSTYPINKTFNFAYYEYVQDFIPSGEFTYILDFSSYSYNEKWDSPDLKEKIKYSNSLTYYPFRNCSGIPNSLFNPYSIYYGYPWDFPIPTSNIDPLNPPPNVAPYESEYATINYYWFFAFFNTGSYFRNSEQFVYYRYYNQDIWDKYVSGGAVFQHIIDVCNFYNAQNIEEGRGGYSPDNDSNNPCTNQEIIDVYGASSILPILKPQQPVNIGDYQTFIDYMNENDYSLGIKSDNNCSNGVNKVIDVLPIVDKSSYVFQNVYSGYSEISRFVSFNPSGFFKTINSANVVKKGFVLSSFDAFSYFLGGSSELSIVFSMIPETFWYFSLFDCPQNEWEEIITHGQIGLYDPCGFKITSYNKFYWENDVSTIFEKSFYPTTFELYGTYENNVLQNIYTFSKFTNLAYDYSGNNFQVPFFFPRLTKYDQNNQPEFLPQQSSADTFWRNLSIVFSKYKDVVPSTNESGLTTLTFRDCDFVGPTYVNAIFKNTNPSSVSTGKLPETYNAYLCVGFRCDIEIQFQSSPLCKAKDIPDKLKRVEELKIKLENYSKIEQYNWTSRDFAEYITNISSKDANVRASTRDIQAFTDNGYYSYSASNVIYAPPDLNIDNEFVIKRKGNQIELVKNIQTQSMPEIKTFRSKWYNYYDDFFPERFDSCLVVNGSEEMWQTGNELTFNGTPSQFLPIPSNGKYYCIFVKKIWDGDENISPFLIRVANTYQKAIDGVYIKTNPYSSGSVQQTSSNSFYYEITVKYNYYKKDVSLNNVPAYSNFSISNYDDSNKILNDYFISYTKSFSTNYPTGKMYFSFSNPYYPSTYYENYFDKFQFAWFYFENQQYSNQFMQCDLRNSKIELISMNPLKFKYIDAEFISSFKMYYSFEIESFYKVYGLIPPLNQEVGFFHPVSQASSVGTWGFKCDIVVEENIRSDNKKSLPIEFNQIPQMIGYIQTSGVYNSKSPLKMINPEKCTHIGKVIDRKDCNCPKKWIRQCEIHETTDWKKCMSCPNYQPED